MSTASRKFYNVYKNGKEYMCGATMNEIRAELGENITTKYADQGWNLNGEYVIRRRADLDDLWGRYIKIRDVFTWKMFLEWTTMNQRYGNRL